MLIISASVSLRKSRSRPAAISWTCGLHVERMVIELRDGLAGEGQEVIAHGGGEHRADVVGVTGVSHCRSPAPRTRRFRLRGFGGAAADEGVEQRLVIRSRAVAGRRGPGSSLMSLGHQGDHQAGGRAHRLHRLERIALSGKGALLGERPLPAALPHLDTFESSSLSRWPGCGRPCGGLLDCPTGRA